MASSSIAELHQAGLRSSAIRVAMLVAWHTLSVEETAQRLGTGAAHGLTRAEAARRYAQDGPNALPAVKARSGLSILLHQFRSLIVLLLLAAGGVALALGESVEAVAAAVYVPFLQAVLHTVALSARDWGLIAGCSLTPVAVVELFKLLRRLTTRTGG